MITTLARPLFNELSISFVNDILAPNNFIFVFLNNGDQLFLDDGRRVTIPFQQT